MTSVAAMKPIDPLPTGLDSEFYKTVLDGAVIGIVIADRQHRILYSNPAFHQISGYPAGFLAGASLFDMAPGGDSYSHEAEFKRLWAGEIDSITVEHPFARRDGRRSWAAMTASLRRNAEGAIEYTILQFSDIDQRKKAEAKLAYAATHDSLTGLPNRLAFDTALNAAIASGAAGYLGLIDLDRFKGVNDSCGHAAGDALLKAVVSQIRECVRESDMVARIGGDEFAIVLDDCSQGSAVEIGRKVIAAIGALRFTWEGQTHGIGASIGLTAIGGEVVNADALYRRADEACYNAKGAGRGQVMIL